MRKDMSYNKSQIVSDKSIFDVLGCKLFYR